ncbi:polygalacturonase QRT3-like [Camellia sinensis]|uniref:polygalacturonase QRT3-like n=1 Tax=Camellia sinensis TaxID=4442 RepID=UPI0010361647|nr:polygalacturonase QRT3-like [Camellia sinensis]
MRPFSPLLFFFLLFLAGETCSCSLQQQQFYEFQKKIQQKTTTVLAAKPQPSPVAPNIKKSRERVFYPIVYGADPTGAQDSSDAIQSVLEDALQVQNGIELLPGIKDLGGVVIDLQGGNYLISKPIRFPSGIGNFLVQGGSFRASDTFPSDRHLIELWAPNSQPLTNSEGYFDQKSPISYEDITFRDILFDSSYRGGGIFVIDSARIRIHDCFFIHFTSEGILVQKGHETFISTSFLGQRSTVGGDKGERDFSGTAIDLASNDNAVTDVVIFSAATGIILRGQANLLTGVHCYNKATVFGGVGILVKSAQNRIHNCYMDYNAIVIEDPFQVQVANGFFLGDGNIVLKSIKGKISGLNIINNMFSGEPKNMVPIVKLDGQFTSVDQVVIDHNNVDGMSLKSTVGKLAVSGNGTKWVIDFSFVLVFPNKINHVHYSFYASGVNVVGFPLHAITNVSSNVVVVESDRAVTGVVSMAVDQNNMVGERNFLM